MPRILPLTSFEFLYQRVYRGTSWVRWTPLIEQPAGSFKVVLLPPATLDYVLNIAADCLGNSCLDAVQVHGTVGYMTELEFERELRDAVGSRLYSGTSEIQRNIIAKGMLRV